MRRPIRNPRVTLRPLAGAILSVAACQPAELPLLCEPVAALPEEDRTRVHFAHPQWSRDGSAVTIDCGLGEARELCLFDPSEGHVTRLTSTPDNEAVPSFSPDGGTLSYSVQRDGVWHLALLDLQTGVSRDLLPLRGDQATSSSWSPDGLTIAFDMPTEDDPADYDIYTIAIDGTDVRSLVTGPGAQRFPAWSPDGRTLAYHETMEGQTDVVLRDRAGGTERPAATPQTEALPIWSLEGAQLTFYSNRTGNMEVFSVDLATGETTQHTDHPAIDLFGSLTPDGSGVLFESNRSRDPSGFDRGADLFRADLASGRVDRLTEPADFPACVGPFPA